LTEHIAPGASITGQVKTPSNGSSDCPGAPYCVCACHFEASLDQRVQARLRERLMVRITHLAALEHMLDCNAP